MEYLSRLPLFVRVVRLGSFAAVARELDMTPSAVSKQIQRLETELGVRLFQRTTRQLSLTEDGQRYYEQAAPLIESLIEGANQLRDQHDSIVGRIRMTSPNALLSHGLADAISEFASQNPAIEIEVEGGEQYVDLLQESFDVAIRIGALSDSSLVARRLAPAPMWMVATPDFVQQYGVPERPEDWSDAPIAVFAGHGRRPYQFAQGGEQVEVRFHGRVQGNQDHMLRAVALSGHGFGIAPAFTVMPEVKTGKLVRLLSDWTILPERNIWAVYPHRQHLPTRTRALIDFLVEWFDRNAELGWSPG